MNFFSNYYIKNDEDSIYLHNVKKFIKFDTELLGDKLDFVLLMFKQNLNFYSEINDYVFNMFYSYNFDLLNDEVKALLTSEPFKKNVQALKKALDEFGTISLENANEIVNKVKEYSGLKGKELFMPIRLVAIAKEHGPEMNKILYVIGREKMLENISKYFGNLI
jgi:glutamyl/glutaminyl-tRNA synthetase